MFNRAVVKMVSSRISECVVAIPINHRTIAERDSRADQVSTARSTFPDIPLPFR
jgi:hypothetical protein